MTEPKTKESVDLSVLLHVDHYLFQGGRIEKRHGLICLVDRNGEHVVGGATTKEMLQSLILLVC